MSQKKEYSTFRDFRIYGKPPSSYKKIRAYLVFEINHNGSYRTRLVVDSNLTDIPLTSIYSRVVSLYSIRIVTFLSELNQLKL